MGVRVPLPRVALAGVLVTCPCVASFGSTPVYVTVAGHIEDNKLYYENCSQYEIKRAQLRVFADVARDLGIAFNLQISYEWLLGMQKCESGNADLLATTGGKNILDYLAEDRGFEIDIHQEGASIADATSGNNFADIRYLAGRITGHVTETTGFQWDNPAQYRSLQGGQRGKLHKAFVWKPEILAGGVSVDHTDGDFSRDVTSIGGWIPSGFSQDKFHVHDTSNWRMFYVGSGPNQYLNDWGNMKTCHFWNTADFVRLVTEYIENGTFASDRLYTTTLFVPQEILFDPDQHARLECVVREMAPLVDSGQVVYAHFTEVAERWRTDYAEGPNIVRYHRISPFDYTCDTYEYAAKLVCGVQPGDDDGLRLVEGRYATAINVYNPAKSSAWLGWKAVLTYPRDDPRSLSGDTLDLETGFELPASAAIEIDCQDLSSRLFPLGAYHSYVEGFLVIRSSDSLVVTPVYTMHGVEGTPAVSIDVTQTPERIQPGRPSSCGAGGPGGP